MQRRRFCQEKKQEISAILLDMANFGDQRIGIDGE